MGLRSHPRRASRTTSPLSCIFLIVLAEHHFCDGDSDHCVAVIYVSGSGIVCAQQLHSNRVLLQR